MEHRCFPERRAYTANYSLSRAETDLYQAVTTYVREEMNRADRTGDDGAAHERGVCTANPSAPVGLVAAHGDEKLGDQPRPPAERIARVAWSGPKSSVPSIDRRSDKRVRARLTRLLIVPTAQSQMAAVSS